MSRPAGPAVVNLGARLFERDSELLRVGGVLEEVLEGQGRVLVVEGAAGTGKSALVAVVGGRAEGAGLRVLRARGSELEREYPFGVVRQLFEPVLATATTREREQMLAGAAGAAEWVLAPDPAAGGERGGSGFAALNGLYWLMVNLAGDTPLLLIVDDAHWADVSSLRALNFLAARTSDLPVAILAAWRPVEPGAPTELLDALRTHPDVLSLTLGPLGRDSVAHIVRERLPWASEAVCEACTEVSAGNPLYLQELLHFVADSGLLAAPDPPALVRQASVPSLGDRVVRRIAGVAPHAPALTAAMAVLGDGAGLEIAARLAGIAPAQAGDIAHQLRRIEILAAEDPFAFVHPVVRRSVYDHLSELERQEAHAAAATLLREAAAPPDAVATHLALVRPKGSSATAMALFEAGQRALTQAAPDEAVRWFARALEEDAPEPPPAAILAQLGMTEGVLKGMTAVGHLREALERAEDLELRTRVAVALAEILGHAGEWDVATSVVADAEQAVAGEPELEAEVAAVKCAHTVFDPERMHEFERERPRFRRLSEGDGWAAHALAAILAAAAATRGEGADRVLSLADRALAGGRLLRERGAGAWASAQLLGALMIIEAHDRAEAATDLVLEASRRDGSLFGTATAHCFRAWIHAWRGDLPGAEVKLTTVLEIGAAADLPMINVTAFYFAQDVILERPSLDPVAARVEATELNPIFERTWTGAMLHQVRGRLRLARRDLAGGIDDLRAAGRIATALRFGPGISSWRSSLALALGPDDHDEASALVCEELDLARTAGLRRASAVAVRTAGMLEGGEPGIERLRESVSMLADTEARLEHARSLVELGAALRRAGRRVDARPPLEDGMELARRCGAERLLARAHEELQAAGGRPRRTARSGRDALTASELRVARLAAEGASNPQIAQELYISPKTVETHLSHAYSKLGLSGQGSRARLAEALEEVEPAMA